MPEDDHIVDYRTTAYSPQLRERREASMSSASGPEYPYSPQSDDVAPENGANDNGTPPRNAWWRLGASRWAAVIALTGLLAATTVHAFVLAPRELPFAVDHGGLPPEVRA